MSIFLSNLKISQPRCLFLQTQFVQEIKNQAEDSSTKYKLQISILRPRSLEALGDTKLVKEPIRLKLPP